MKYPVTKNEKYDFAGQSYAAVYPNLHKYPATMLPQIGIEILDELNIKKGKMLDPYCGSGSSFAAGLEFGFEELYGYDINPLAVLISKAKFTKLNLSDVKRSQQKLIKSITKNIENNDLEKSIETPQIYNVDYWFSKEVLKNLTIIKYFIDKVPMDVRRLFLLAFSETVRDCSYTRNNEFKLYRIKPADVPDFNPDVFGVFFDKLNKVIDIYQYCYHPKINGTKIKVSCDFFPLEDEYFDVVLTSPPYGDSKTTVAYGQFSMFSNHWLGVEDARKIDSRLMGGKKANSLYQKGIIADYICKIDKSSPKRALEVSSFYFDLESSIKNISKKIKPNGKAVYVVGNRRVKDVQLPTDQFIAEKFEENGLTFLFTYERVLGNKTMPSKNSPSNKIGAKRKTMSKEYIIVCEK
ncbi:MAG: modification methylase [Aridibacter sp.]